MVENVPLAVKVLAAALIILALTWFGLAWSSGAFLSRGNAWAVAPGEVTDDGFAHQKKIVEIGGEMVAYVDIGQGPPLILLHGCPFSAVEWRDVIPMLSKHYRVIAPDLIGLGDTPVRLDQDYRLPRDVAMVRALMDYLGVARADFVAHDHGGATILLLMNDDPGRIGRVVLTNIEAYDLWPSEPELPYLRGIVNPLTSPILFHAFRTEWLQREAFGVAFHEPEKVTAATYRAFTAQHIATRRRWQRLRRFFAWQLDPVHNTLTMDALAGMRVFNQPVLLLWGAQDENFGPEIARRLARDIPGAVGVHWLRRSAHMPMLEEPEAYASSVLTFLKDAPAGAFGPDFEPAALIREGAGKVQDAKLGSEP